MLYADTITNIPGRLSEADLKAFKEQYADSTGAGKSFTEIEAMEMLWDAEEGEENEMFPEYENELENYQGSWVEMQTTDFKNDIATLDLDGGDIAGPITTALAIQRQINGKDQRIVVIGDADCFSNQDVAARKVGIEADNSNFVNGVFHWVTNGEAPSDTRRPEAPDVRASISASSAKVYYLIYRFVFPGIFLVFLVVIWSRRRSR